MSAIERNIAEMEDFVNLIIEFVKTYYMFIALGFSFLIFVLDIVILAIKNKAPLLSVLAKIRELVPGAVKAAEATLLKGDAKLAFAVDIIKGYLLKVYPKLDADKYTRYIEDTIEEILSTPQKKGD